MTDDGQERVPVNGSTPQGERVAAHWARLSLTVDGAMQALRSNGIPIEQATASDLHGLDMLHMGGLAATDALAQMAALQTGQTATSMERNLRERRLQVGMVVYRRTRDANGA